MQTGWDPIDELEGGGDEPAWATWLLVALLAFGAFVELVCR